MWSSRAGREKIWKDRGKKSKWVGRWIVGPLSYGAIVPLGPRVMACGILGRRKKAGQEARRGLKLCCPLESRANISDQEVPSLACTNLACAMAKPRVLSCGSSARFQPVAWVLPRL